MSEDRKEGTSVGIDAEVDREDKTSVSEAFEAIKRQLRDAFCSADTNYEYFSAADIRRRAFSDASE